MAELSKSRTPVMVVLLVAAASAAWFIPKLVDRGALETAEQRAANERAAAGAAFREVAAESGLDFRMAFLPGEQGENFKINLYDHGCGVVAGDYDADGDDDLYFLNQLGPNVLYRNRGDGTFEDVTGRTGDAAVEGRICVGGTFGDYDNDGDQDLYVTTTRGGNVLLENRDGKFVDVSAAAGVGLVAHSQTAAFFDVDGDGDLDLFVTNTARWTTDAFEARGGYYVGPQMLFDYVKTSDRIEHNNLFRNNGDGTFTDVARKAGVRGRGWGGDVAAFDYDDDGDLDLFVTNMFGQSQLYANNGKGKFKDVTDVTLHRTSFGAIGSKAFDYNNDGRLDLLVADMHSDMWIDFPGKPDIRLVQPTRKYQYFFGRYPEIYPESLEGEKEYVALLGIDYDKVLFGNSLFKNDGGGAFTEVSDAAGAETFWPWGIATGDLNNDGFEDALVPSGMGYPYFYWPNCLLMNKGDGTFVDGAFELGLEPPPGGKYLDEPIGDKQSTRSSRCAVCAEFDGDGRLDIVVNNFNDVPYYFRNQMPRRNYVAFRLTGTRSNRDAIGALVKIRLGRQTLVRQVHCAGGYLSQSSRTLHFGLGDHERIGEVEIRWPSGRRQTVKSLPINKVHSISEPADQPPAEAEPAAGSR